MADKLSDEEREYASQIVALFAALVHAWATNDFRDASRSRDDLERLGVTVKLPRMRSAKDGNSRTRGGRGR